MKHYMPVLLLVLYAAVHRPTGDTYESYEGMPREIVSSLIQARGFTFRFISKSEFDSAIKARQIDSTSKSVEMKNGYKTLHDNSASANDRLNALISILGL